MLAVGFNPVFYTQSQARILMVAPQGETCSLKPSESMGLTAKLDDGVSCDGVHEADDDGGRQLKTKRSLYLENFAVNPHRLTPP